MPSKRHRINIRLVATPDKLTDRIRTQLNELDAALFPEDAAYPKDGGYWWVAYMNHQPVAFAGLKPLSNPNKGMGFLCRAGVLKVSSGYGLQRRLIQIRVRKAKKIGLTQVITYASRDNYRSAANLLRSGLRFYSPQNEWGVPGALYFHTIF